MRQSIVNPLIEPIAREIYRLKNRPKTETLKRQTSCNSEYVDPHHIETRMALAHFNALPYTEAVLLRGAHGWYIKVSWLETVEA